jgi:hypothetical protein
MLSYLTDYLQSGIVVAQEIKEIGTAHPAVDRVPDAIR